MASDDAVSNHGLRDPRSPHLLLLHSSLTVDGLFLDLAKLVPAFGSPSFLSGWLLLILGDLVQMSCLTTPL